MYRNISRFLDLEAAVDDSREADNLDEDSESDEGFIDDDYDLDVEEIQESIQHSSTPSDNHETPTWLDNIVDRWSASTTGVADDQDTGHDESLDEFWQNVAQQVNSTTPTWRIGCRSSVSELALKRVIQIFNAPGFYNPCIPGWIYVELSIDNKVDNILETIPGILRNRKGVIREQVDLSEYIQARDMSPLGSNYNVRSFVRVLRGPYAGDPAIVTSISTWGVDVLLIPRINYNHNGKRKRGRSSTKPPQCLFKPERYRRRLPVVRMGENRYSVGVNNFEHGLLLKTFGFRSVSAESIGLTSWQCGTFLSSGHPVVQVTTIALPVEWSISVGDQVTTPTVTSATVERVEEWGARLQNNDTGEQYIAAWQDVVKLVNVGDFVEVCSGEHMGRNGWVYDVSGEGGDTLKVLDMISSNAEPVEFVICANWVNKSSPPFEHLLPAQLLIKKLPKDVLPWIGVSVRVSKLGHPSKGKVGVVQGVSLGAPPSHSIRLQVSFEGSYDPNAPYPIESIDFYDVVSTRTGLTLDRFGPLRKTAVGGASVPGIQNKTPAWDGNSSKTPAWNPNSETPYFDRTPSMTPTQGGESSISSTQVVVDNPGPSHPFLKAELIGVPLRARLKVAGSKNMDATIYVRLVDDRLSMFHKLNHVNKPLDPDVVTPWHPDPYRTKGRCVWIGNEYPGMYVRRIPKLKGYESSEKGKTWWTKVNPVENKPDEIVNFPLLARMEDLCVVFESREERKWLGDMEKMIKDFFLRQSEL